MEETIIQGKSLKIFRGFRYDYEGVTKADANTLMNNLNGKFEFFNVFFYFKNF